MKARFKVQAKLTSELELRMKQVVFLRFPFPTTSREVRKGKISHLASKPSPQLKCARYYLSKHLDISIWSTE